MQDVADQTADEFLTNFGALTKGVHAMTEIVEKIETQFGFLAVGYLQDHAERKVVAKQGRDILVNTVIKRQSTLGHVEKLKADAEEKQRKNNEVSPESNSPTQHFPVATNPLDNSKRQTTHVGLCRCNGSRSFL